MITIPPTDRQFLAPLFSSHHRWRPLIDSILEGRCGIAEADALSRPRVAQLTLGFFAFYGGAAILDCTGAAAANAARPDFEGRWIEFTDPAWRDRLLTVHGAKRFKHELTRFDLDPGSLDRSRLETIMRNVSPGFRLVPVADEGLAVRVTLEIESALTHAFESPSDFVARGFGWCAIEEATGRPVSAATTYAVSATGAEIEVDTHPDFRRRGLATAVGASTVAESLARGLRPDWDAISRESADLAVKLGYRLIGPYRACWLDPEGY